MAVQNQDEIFENFESNFFSFQSVLLSAISKQLNKDNFSILYLNIRSRTANTDNFRDFLASPNFAKFTGKHLCQSPYFNKVSGLCKISKNTFFTAHLWTTASNYYKYFFRKRKVQAVKQFLW